MKNVLLWAVALTGVAAYPHLPENFEEEVERPFDFDHQSRATPALEISKKETNCGPAACTKFEEAKQFRSTTGKHAYQSPAITDIRGPCPGLNAAANHGYIPRNGLMGYYSTIEGMFDMYSLSREFNAFLVAYAILMTGDLVSMKWSIGGPQPYKNLGGALAPPQGISFSHNKYEGDVSIGRNDAYMANGDAHSLNVTRFRNAFEAGMGDNRYTLHKWRGEFTRNVYRSIRENPYYFSPPFAGAAVAPAAYNFAINFMSNHSAEEPSGYLDAYNFKQFFAVRGNYPNFRWVRGQERIPDNWYARPASEPYGAIPTVADVALTWAVYPKSLKVGGNTGKKDSYVGVDLGELTGGTFTASNLLQGNNAGCFIFLSAQEAIPDQLKGGVNDVAAATALFKKVAAPIFKKLGCGQLGKYDSSLFSQFPGNSYNPTGKPTNY